MEAMIPYGKENISWEEELPPRIVLMTDRQINFYTIRNLIAEYCKAAVFDNIIISDTDFPGIIDTINEYEEQRLFLINSDLSIRPLELLSVIVKSLSTDHKILVVGNEHIESNIHKINLSCFDGVLSCKSGLPDLLRALIIVREDGFYYDSNLKCAFHPGRRSPDNKATMMLSDRELQIAKMFIEGKSNGEICNALDLKPSTISTFKKRLLMKLDIKSLMDLRDFLNVR